MKTKLDMMIGGQLIDCLSLCLSVCCHMFIMWLFGPVRAQLMLCGYPHVSVLLLSSSMLITATGRWQCVQIWIWESAILKQSQSQNGWRSFPLHIYVSSMWCHSCILPQAEQLCSPLPADRGAPSHGRAISKSNLRHVHECLHSQTTRESCVCVCVCVWVEKQLV